MARVNRYPKGLQSLLATKGTGTNPQEISSIVQPVIDLSNFYYADATLEVGHAVESTSAAPYASVAEVEIPATEVWAVPMITAQVFADGALSVDLTPGMLLSGFSLVTPLGNCREVVSSLSNTQSFWHTYTFPEIVVFGPGTIFSGVSTKGALGDGVFHTYVPHYKLDI